MVNSYIAKVDIIASYRDKREGLNETRERFSRGLVPLDSVNGNLPVNGVEREAE